MTNQNEFGEEPPNFRPLPRTMPPNRPSPSRELTAKMTDEDRFGGRRRLRPKHLRLYYARRLFTPSHLKTRHHDGKGRHSPAPRMRDSNHAQRNKKNAETSL